MRNSLGLAISTAALLGCGGQIDSASLEGATLTMSIADSSGLRGELAIADEHVTVESSLRVDSVEATDPEQPLVERRLRATTVRGASGAVYAKWDVDADSGEVTGTIGDQSFGRFQDRTTDMDHEVWRPVASSHAGEVLAALSKAAAALKDGGQLAAVDKPLSDLVNISPIVRHLAGLATTALGEVAPDSVGGTKDYSYRTLAARQCDVFLPLPIFRVCSYQFSSATIPHTRIQAPLYCAAIYDQAGHFIRTSCDGAKAEARDDFYDIAKSICRVGKHWRIGDPTPRWSSACAS